MTRFTPEVKHAILLEYSASDTSRGFAALARRHEVRGGWRVVKRWFERWDRTPQSLKEHDRSGRPPVLDADEAAEFIQHSVDEANRNHRAIDYVEVTNHIRDETGVEVSVRTVRRWGRQIGVRNKRAISRTEKERRVLQQQERALN